MDVNEKRRGTHLFPFFNRDISWISFNERILKEAARDTVFLMDRIKFLSIYSSNLDEFYRVRIPALVALNKVNKPKKNFTEWIHPSSPVLEEVKHTIALQLELFGKIICEQIIPKLRSHHIRLIYQERLEDRLFSKTNTYFLTRVLTFLQPWKLGSTGDFFPANNKLYFVVQLQGKQDPEEVYIVNIPSDNLPRFFYFEEEDLFYILFLDDIVKYHLPFLFKNSKVQGAWSFKITRDAELDLRDDYEGDIAEKIEKQLTKRDYGLATRFLFDAGMPQEIRKGLMKVLNLRDDSMAEGGRYHNLKDLADLRVVNDGLYEQDWRPVPHRGAVEGKSILEEAGEEDMLFNPPYQAYDPVLQFFNEAATHPGVKELYVTLYRVAAKSQIVNALITAARNGKVVTVFVELKARFDEANNLRWARKMKAAGVKIIYSIPGLKVHAKVALVKLRKGADNRYVGLLATGNLNESTARFYTDHILITSHRAMLKEMESLFVFLTRRIKPPFSDFLEFGHLLVAQFNLHERFLELIDREIENARRGLPASLTIKLNNLEEKVLISHLYEASNAGVKIHLLIRSICCLIPGVEGMSSNITVKRIVDRYLEHGRVFIFHNNGHPEVFLGSSDWMNRNIYRRIEVCFPVYNEVLKDRIIRMMEIQWNDTAQAVVLNSKLENHFYEKQEEGLRSQKCLYRLFLDEASGE